MQAGLAILYHIDEEYVAEVVQRARCGLGYNPLDIRGFAAQIHSFLDNPQKLTEMKKNAHRFVQTEFK
jgi:glycosyltransferase involved in cell wall biosynthesis